MVPFLEKDCLRVALSWCWLANNRGAACPKEFEASTRKLVMRARDKGPFGVRPLRTLQNVLLVSVISDMRTSGSCLEAKGFGILL